MKKTLGLGIMALTALTLAACGKDSTQAAQNTVSPTVNTDSLQGTYVSACTNIPGSVLGLSSYNVKYDITGNLDIYTTYYNSNDCTPQNEVLDIHTQGTYVPHDNAPVTPQIPANTVEIDLVAQHEIVTPKTQALVDAMNLANYCGINNWSVTDTPSTPAARNVDPAAGTTDCFGTDPLATTYDLMNTQNNQLKFGLADATHNKTTPAERPAALDPTVVATKQ